jgi:hypothetical protein
MILRIVDTGPLWVSQSLLTEALKEAGEEE